MTEPKYHIAVSQQQYDRMIKRLGALQRETKFIMHDFEGDDFQTKIWLETAEDGRPGKLMAEDPKYGIRQISVMDYKDGMYILDGQIMRGLCKNGQGPFSSYSHELNPVSTKARILEQLLRDGIPFDKANQIAVIMALNMKEGKSFSGVI